MVRGPRRSQPQRPVDAAAPGELVQQRRARRERHGAHLAALAVAGARRRSARSPGRPPSQGGRTPPPGRRSTAGLRRSPSPGPHAAAPPPACRSFSATGSPGGVTRSCLIVSRSPARSVHQRRRGPRLVDLGDRGPSVHQVRAPRAHRGVGADHVPEGVRALLRAAFLHRPRHERAAVPPVRLDRVGAQGPPVEMLLDVGQSPLGGRHGARDRGRRPLGRDRRGGARHRGVPLGVRSQRDHSTPGTGPAVTRVRHGDRPSRRQPRTFVPAIEGARTAVHRRHEVLGQPRPGPEARRAADPRLLPKIQTWGSFWGRPTRGRVQVGEMVVGVSGNDGRDPDVAMVGGPGVDAR